MSLFITSLNSGSNGNCYYVGNNNEAVLVDVGISCKEVELRMKRLDLPLARAILRRARAGKVFDIASFFTC